MSPRAMCWNGKTLCLLLLLLQGCLCLQPKDSHHGNTEGPPGQSQCAVSGGSMPTGVIETVHPASGSRRSTAEMKMIGFRGGMGEFLTGRTWCGVVPPANLLFPQRKLKAAAWTGFSNDPSCVSFKGAFSSQNFCGFDYCSIFVCI